MCRPVKYKTVEELQVKIDEYFNKCDKEFRPYTITGLALALNMTREGLVHYEKKEGFTDTIKRAKLKCEVYAEEQLFIGRNATGVIFNLKNNYGWVDKQEVDNTIKAQVDNKVDLSGLSVDDIKKILDK